MSLKTNKRTQFYMSMTHLYHNTTSKQDVWKTNTLNYLMYN